MSVGGKYDRYDSIINQISKNDVKENVGARLIIHVLDQEYDPRSGVVKFDDGELPHEMDAFFYGKSYKDSDRQHDKPGEQIAWHFNEAFVLFKNNLKDEIDSSVRSKSDFETALINTLYPASSTRAPLGGSRRTVKKDNLKLPPRSTFPIGSGSDFVPTKFLPINIDKNLLSL